MAFLNYPTRLHRNNASKQDAMILRTSRRINMQAYQANMKEQRYAEYLTKQGVLNREYMNFVTGLNEYLTL